MSNLAQSDLLFAQKWAHFLNRCQATWDVCPTWETSFLFSRGRGDIEIYDVFDAAAMFAPLLFRAHKFITGKRKKRRFVPLQLPPRCRGRVKCKSDGRTLLCATFPKWPVKVVLWCFQLSEPHSVWLIIAGDRISRSLASRQTNHLYAYWALLAIQLPLSQPPSMDFSTTTAGVICALSWFHYLLVPVVRFSVHHTHQNLSVVNMHWYPYHLPLVLLSWRWWAEN
jgi:hypothetical protein